jgi:hypothetical protein
MLGSGMMDSDDAERGAPDGSQQEYGNEWKQHLRLSDSAQPPEKYVC